MPSSRRPWLPLIAGAVLLAPAPPALAGEDRLAYDCDGDVCVVDPDAAAPLNLTPGTVASTESRPDWSPDGTRIAYDSDYLDGAQTRNDQIYVTEVASPGIGLQVTDSATVAYSAPVWSPDGTVLAMHGYDAGGVARISLAPSDGSAAATRISSGTLVENHPRWSPDGTRLSFTRSPGTWAGDAVGAAPSLIAGGLFANWSPDGTRIATSRPQGAGNADRARVTRLADGTFGEFTLDSNGQAPAFSPDGTTVVWYDNVVKHLRIAPADASADGTALPLGDLIVVRDFSFSPDGTRIAFSAANAANTQRRVYVVAADGTSPPRSVSNAHGDADGVRWKPRAVTPPVTPGGGTGGTGGGAGGGTGGAGGGGPAGTGAGTGPAPAGPTTTAAQLPPGAPQAARLVRFSTFRLYPTAAGGFVGAAFVNCPTGQEYRVAERTCVAHGRIYTQGIAPARTSAKRKRVLLGSTRIRIAPGTGKTLRIKLNRAGRRLVRRGTRARLLVTVTLRQADRTGTQRKVVTLRARARR